MEGTQLANERIVYLNGKYVPESQATIHVSDRGFIFGDAVFDTARTFKGEIYRLKDHIGRLMRSLRYLRIDPVSSREQYRWMERFIATVEDEELRRRLNIAIDGKGAFRRFKDALMSHPVDRERWFAFRSERLRSCMESWLTAHGIHSVERPTWHVPTADEVHPEPDAPAVAPEAKPDLGSAAELPPPAETGRTRLHELVDGLAVRDLEMAGAFLEFLRARRHAPRPQVKAAPEPAVAAEAKSAETT